MEEIKEKLRAFIQEKFEIDDDPDFTDDCVDMLGVPVLGIVPDDEELMVARSEEHTSELQSH